MVPFQIANIFEAIADAIPEREALVCEGRRYTYAQVDERATRLAHALAARGIGRGDHVGTYMYNSAEYVTAMIAAFKIGAVPVNVNYRYVEDELRYLFDNADLKGLVFHREFAPRVAVVRDECPLLRALFFVEDGTGADVAGLGAAAFEESVSTGSPRRDFTGRSPDDLFIIYTGGTTGMPKGVMWRHEDIFFAGLAGGNPTGEPVKTIEELVERTRTGTLQITTFSAAPLIHGAAQLATFITFNSGGRLVLQKKFEADDAVRLLAEEKVNTLTLVGDAMARPLAEAMRRRLAAGGCDLSNLWVISSAGAIFSEPVKAMIKELLPNSMLLDNYGSTETGFQGTGAGGETKSFGQGLSFKMNERTVVLDEKQRIVQPGSGILGRVALRGHVPLGYYKDPKKSAETFVVLDGVRHSITGDIASVEADGTVRLYGRGSVCINTGGEKVFIEEVENAIKSFPGVYDTVVVGIDDPNWGQRVAALVAMEPDVERPTPAEIQAHLRTKIAGYKVPKEIHVVDEVFRGPNGKADYQLAREIATRLSAAA